MTNPVLAKSEVFSPGFVQQQSYGPGQYPPPYSPNQPQGQYPGQYPSGVNQFAPQGQQPGYQQSWQVPSTSEPKMTLDDVLTKTAITLGLVVLVAVGTVTLTQALGINPGLLMCAGLIAALATLIFPFIAASRRKVGPGIAISFAVLEGIFIGSISWLFSSVYDGIVVQAVIATTIAVGITLAAFKFGNFRLSTRMRKIVAMSTIGFVGVVLVNLVLSLTGVLAHGGLFPGPTGHVSTWAWIAAGVGTVLAVLSLVDDFQFVEQGIQNGVPASESWRAAYGLTVTLVWLYVNLLRILSYIRR